MKRYPLVLTGEEAALLMFLTRLGLAQVRFDAAQPDAERAEEIRMTTRLIHRTPVAVHKSLVDKLSVVMEGHMKELEERNGGLQ